jgi:hypothetical protein
VLNDSKNEQTVLDIDTGKPSKAGVEASTSKVFWYVNSRSFKTG